MNHHKVSDWLSCRSLTGSVPCAWQDAATQSGELAPPPAEEAAAVDAQPAQEPHVKHDIMAAKRAVQQPDGHFNFWRAEELRESNAETKVLPGRACGQALHVLETARAGRRRADGTRSR